MGEKKMKLITVRRILAILALLIALLCIWVDSWVLWAISCTLVTVYLFLGLVQTDTMSETDISPAVINIDIDGTPYKIAKGMTLGELKRTLNLKAYTRITIK